MPFLYPQVYSYQRYKGIGIPFCPSSVTFFIAHFYFVHTNIICQSSSHLEFIRISHPSSLPSSFSSLMIHTTLPTFSPHFIYQPLSTFSCHKHTNVTNLPFLLSKLIAFFLLRTPDFIQFSSHILVSNHFPDFLLFHCALFLLLFSLPSSTICHIHMHLFSFHSSTI